MHNWLVEGVSTMLRIPSCRQPRIPTWSQAGLDQSGAVTPLSGGTEISVQEAVDLLHRLREETAQVQAIYACADGVSWVLRGIVRSPIEDGLWAIASQHETMGSALSFDVSSTTVRQFGDEAALSVASAFPFRFHFVSALIFGFGDGSTLSLFELDPDQTARYR